jgi:uncharacterized protein
LISLLSSFLIAAAAAEVPVPPLGARVTDLSATLSDSQRAALEAKLAAFEQKKGSQVAVLLVPTTQPEAIEPYAIRVAEAWKLGRARVDDGVLLVVAKNDRKLRIEVGRGLEGALPDAIAKRIVSDVIAPRFKQGDFYGGIDAGVDRILRTIEGEPLPAPGRAPARGFDAGWFEIAFFVLMAASFAQVILLPLLGRLASSAAVGGVVGFVVWLLSALLGIAVLAGIVAFLLALFAPVSSGRRWSPAEGWSSGGGGWSGGSSSSDGGGFSGGGGDFGGGGASGDW